MNVLKRNILS